jgi:hypothetical protein
VGGIDDQEVSARVDQGLGPPLRVLSDAHGGADHQAALSVLGRVGELLALGEVLHRDQAAQQSLGVHERELLDLVLRQQPERLLP